MPATKERLTKTRVREEVVTLRRRINEYLDMDEKTLEETYIRDFPANKHAELTNEERRRTLIMSATYHLTNVLNIE